MATATATLKRMYIDGKWCEADNGKTLGVINLAGLWKRLIKPCPAG